MPPPLWFVIRAQRPGTPLVFANRDKAREAAETLAPAIVLPASDQAM